MRIPQAMKVLTVNFLTCAIKACKSSPLSFPLHFKDAELEQLDIEYNPSFLQNMLPRIDWDALKVTASEVRHLFLSIPQCMCKCQVHYARTCFQLKNSYLVRLPLLAHCHLINSLSLNLFAKSLERIQSRL